MVCLIIVGAAVWFFTARVGQDLFLRLQFPARYSEYVERYAEEMNVNPNLVYAIIKNESNFRRNAQSPVGAMGLMQLMEPTAYDVAHKHGVMSEFTIDDIFEPSVNIRLGTWYFANLYHNVFDGNLVNALAAYNAGQGNVNEWLRNPDWVEDGTLVYIPFGETRRYVERVLNALEVYERLNRR